MKRKPSICDYFVRMVNIHHPHDKLFKAAFGKEIVTRDFLLSRLPADILAQIDLDTLQRENNSFLDSRLRPYYADAVFKVKTVSGDGYLFLLLEQQTKGDVFIPLRFLEYDVAIMRYEAEKQLKVQKNISEKQPAIFLPAIFNFLIYTGKEPWKYPTRLIDAFRAPQLLYRMFEENFCISLNQETTEHILKDGTASVAELILREGWRKDFCHLLADSQPLIKLINQSHYGEELMLYILNRDPHHVDEILKKIPNLDPTLEQNVMTALQRIEQQGIEKGIQKGIQKGIEKGIQKGIEKGLAQGRAKIKDLLKRGWISQAQAEQALKEL
ncbi:MAG: Rpn family recombination-promoting nuclease/putative transposase [Bacteroidota bacterium]